MRHTRGMWAVLLSGIILGAGQVAAQEIKYGTCYRTEVPRSYGPVRSITARLDKSGVEIQFTEWDAPNATFLASASCEGKGRLILCSIDCDGGHADLAVTQDGKLSILARGLRTLATGEPSRLLGSLDADGGVLYGLYLLSESNAEQCEPDGEAYLVKLEPGDDTPAVAEAEKLLNDLGFLLEKPDNIYSDRTADAVAGFQSAAGLKPSGIIDAETARKLISEAAASGGC